MNRRRQPATTAPQIRVLLDTTWGNGQGGTARYVRSIQAALRTIPDIEIVSARAPRLHRGHRIARMPANGILHLLWTQLWLPARAFWCRADILHATMTAPVWCPCPVVLTLHDALDFVPELRPSRIWSTYMHSIGALAARRAALVLTGTYASATEIARHYRVAPDRLQVTPYGTALLGLNLPQSPRVGAMAAASPCSNGTTVKQGEAAAIAPTRNHMNLGDTCAGYVLMVGMADRRKDIGTGLRAVELARAGGVAVRAVVVGSVPDEFATAGWVTVVRDVSDGELARLYAHALAVVVPSRHEGFGLPVVEALAFGTPVIAADIPALREVGGDAARYATVGDVVAFATELTRISESPAFERERLAIAARTAQELTWAATASATVALYRNVCERGE